MIKDIKEKWLVALRSGEYKQTTGALRDEAGHCCLGVLCDLYSKEKNVPWTIGDGVDDSFLGADTALPRSVASWAGLYEADPTVTASKGLGDNIKMNLSEVNDGGASFAVIADLIERDL
jgi:hypothetical protein